MKKLLILFFMMIMFVQTAQAEYDVYKGPLKNEVIDTVTVSKYDIQIERKKMKPTTNVASYAMCYEYIITNNTKNYVTVLTAESEDRITAGGAFGRSQIPQKSDFVPVYGTIRGIKSDIEMDRFTHPLPKNEVILAGRQMRVLTLAPRKQNHVMTFYFLIDGKTLPITVK